MSVDIEELKSVDIRTVSADTLVDIREVVINQDLTGKERMADFIRQIKNPFCYKYKKAVIKIEHTDTEVTLEDRLTSYFASI